MKTKVGLIGKGEWGLKIKKKLNKIADVQFIIGKKKNLINLIKKKQVEWVFIATPNNTHYSLVKTCLQKKVNVFCEKPLSLSLIEAKKLVSFARKKGLKLYVSDLYSFYSFKFNKLKNKNYVYRGKLINEKNPEFLNRLMYHDLDILYKFLKNDSVKIFRVKLNNKKKIYEILLRLKSKKEISFKYNLNSNNKIHTINNFNIRTKEDYLNKMIKNVLYRKVNYKSNNLKALFIIKFLNFVKREIE